MTKKTFIILILPALAIVVGYFIYDVFATSNPHTWTDGLVGYWSFDGQYTTSTDGTADVSGNGNYGQFVGGVKPTAGISGQGMSFDGLDDYVSVADNASLNFGTDSATVMVWAKQSKLSYTPLIYKGGSSVADNGYMLYGHNIMGIKISDGSITKVSASYTTVLNTWYHVVGIINRTTQELLLYVNGVQVGSATDISTVGSITSTKNLQMGWLTGGDILRGLIDEVRIYNRALSAGEVKQHYEQTRRNIQAVSTNPHDWSNGLVGYWDFNGQNTTSTGTTGQGPNAIHGEIVGATPKPGVVGQAFSFDGLDDYINVGNDASLNMTDGKFTVEMWANLQAVDWGYMLGKGYYFQVGGFTLGYHNGAQQWFIIWQGAAQYFGSPALNTWYHLVVTYDSSLGSANFKNYINGKLINTANYQGAVMNNAWNVWIGSDPYDPTNRTFNGLIDEVRIYNRVLPPEEIEMHYEQTRRNVVISSNPHDWSSGLVGYWTMNGQDISGTALNDQSSSNNDGTISGAVGQPGIVGQALSFDGVDDYVAFTPIAYGAKTFEYWVKLNGSVGSNGIFGLRGDASHVGIGFWADSSLYFYLGTGGAYEKYSGTPFADNEWHHVVHTTDGADPMTEAGVKFYIDGVLTGTTGGNGAAIDAWTTLQIGKTDDGYFNGSLDEVRIYDRVLSAEEVKQHYEQTRRNIVL